MTNRIYSMEDPVEYKISDVAQCSLPARSTAFVDEDSSAGWRHNGLLARLGPAVAYERTDGSMALSTWDGNTISVWAKFDVDHVPALTHMREHMIEAISADLPRPFGFILVICFAR